MTVTLRFWRYFVREEEECDSVEDAVARSASIEDYGSGSADSIVDSEGRVLLDREALWEAISAKWDADASIPPAPPPRL